MDTSTRFIGKYPKSLTSGIGFIVKIVTWLLLASRYLYVQLHHRLFTTSTSFARWPPRLRRHCVAVTLHISGIFRYPLSVPVHSSPSREISSRSHLSRKTGHGASSGSSMPKSTRSSYIWLLDTEMEKGSLCSVSLSPADAAVFHTHISSCIMNPWNHNNPNHKPKYSKEIMATSLGKIHLRSAQDSFLCSPLTYLYTSLWCDLICLLTALSNNSPYLDPPPYQKSPKCLNPVWEYALPGTRDSNLLLQHLPLTLCPVNKAGLKRSLLSSLLLKRQLYTWWPLHRRPQGSNVTLLPTAPPAHHFWGHC